MKVLFAGTPINAAHSLAHLVANGIDVVGVLTRLDSLAGRGKQVQESPVALMAKELSLPLHKANTINSEVIDWVKTLRVDVGVVVAFGTIFSKEVLALPANGWINLHYSLLPAYPGPAPVQQALLRGDKDTGVTVFRLDEGVDTGSIVDQKKMDIADSDNSDTLLVKLTDLGAKLLVSVINAGTGFLDAAHKQDTSIGVIHATKPTRQSAKLDFTLSAISQLNKIRAMNPEPMSWFTHSGESVRVLEARLNDLKSAAPSVCRIEGKELVVDCSDASLALLIVQPAGKRPMSGADWFRGLRLPELKII